MDVYPAIDLMDGEAVRLTKGEKGSKKVYGDPLRFASEFSDYVDKIHIIDLDGAFNGDPENLDVVERIISETGLEVEYGGGLREYSDIERAYGVGVDNVIIGTKAFDEDFLMRVVNDFSGVTVSLDVEEGHVKIKGWEEGFLDVYEAYEGLKGQVSRFIYTDISKDGTLSGVDNIERFWEDEEFIYAGGVSSRADILSLVESEFSGFIVGKALYEGNLDLREIKNILGD